MRAALRKRNVLGHNRSDRDGSLFAAQIANIYTLTYKIGGYAKWCQPNCSQPMPGRRSITGPHQIESPYPTGSVPMMNMRHTQFVFNSAATLLLAGLGLHNAAAFADEEICAACGPDVRLSGTFAHRKDNPSLAIEGAGTNAAAYREDVNGTNFTVAITALPAGKYTLTIGAAETSARAACERVFDIASGDTVLAKDFDILAKAGAARKVATISGTVDHADDSVRGPLKISFTSS